MKIVFFWSFYDHYLTSFYNRHPDFADMSNSEQYDILLDDYFSVPGSYTKWANKLGHEATLIVNNCEPIQRRWALENGVSFTGNWATEIAIEQVKRLKPDIFFMSSMFNLYGAFLDEIKKYVGKTMGWISCPIPDGVPLDQMTLILSASPLFVNSFRRMGINSELLLPAFDSDILDKFPKNIEPDVDVSFIGGISPEHKNRYELLEGIAKKTSFKVWGYGVKGGGTINNLRRIFHRPVLERNFMGEAWGIDMYQILRRSKITINCHIDVAGKLAGNMRMFEATGVGTLLLTDNKENLSDIFVPGKEVVAYSTVDEAVDKINYYLTHEKERIDIANAGQQRTLADYNYQKTVQKMLDYFVQYG